MDKTSIPSPGVVTALLQHWGQGNREALDQLIELVYDDLRRTAAIMLERYPSQQPIQPTAVIHEVFVRLSEGTRLYFPNRAHFFSFSGKLIRNILVDHARAGLTRKRGGNQMTISLEEANILPSQGTLDPTTLLTLDRALKELAEFDPRQSRLVELRFFAGLSIAELASCVNLSTSTISRELKMARHWLARKLGEQQTSPNH